MTSLSGHLREAKWEKEGSPQSFFHRLAPEEEIFPLNMLVQDIPARGNLPLEDAQIRQEGKETKIAFDRKKITLPSVDHAELVLKWAKGKRLEKLQVSELARLRVPRSASGCQTLIRRVQKLEEEIARLKASINDLDVLTDT